MYKADVETTNPAVEAGIELYVNFGEVLGQEVFPDDDPLKHILCKVLPLRLA